MADQDFDPPRPRLGGAGPAILGIVGFVAALLIFSLVLVLLDVLPNPLSKSSRAEPQPVAPATSGPAKLAQSARFAKPGECVLNQGTDTKPDLIMVKCEPGSLEVLERKEGTTNVEECRSVPGYRYHYFYDSDLGDSFDFVLCMRKRP
ncbi:LppU/SCO3897 family protein [Rhizocola hellebori]|nr:hypothetical protein [Rhizocola hellebori]